MSAKTTPERWWLLVPYALLAATSSIERWTILLGFVAAILAILVPILRYVWRLVRAIDKVFSKVEENTSQISKVEAKVDTIMESLRLPRKDQH